MGNPRRKGSEEARSQLPSLLDAAEKGEATIITRHGRPVAALVPIDEFHPDLAQQSLTALAGSRSGMWGHDIARFIQDLRDEWSR